MYLVEYIDLQYVESKTITIVKKVQLRKCLKVMSLNLLKNAFSTFAYKLYNEGYYKSSVPINITTLVDPTYTSAINAAVSDWNNVAIPCNIVAGSAPYNNCMVTSYVAATWFGVYLSVFKDSSYEPHITTEFEIWLNRSMLDSQSSKFKQSTVCHELGHAFGLYDLNAGTSIMNVNRDRNTIYTAKLDHILGVNASW